MEPVCNHLKFESQILDKHKVLDNKSKLMEQTYKVTTTYRPLNIIYDYSELDKSGSSELNNVVKFIL